MNDFLKQNSHLLEKPIIVFGTGRSGTTVISEIIFQHEDLAWHSNWQELFPKFAPINYLRRLFDNKYWRVIGMNTQNNKSFRNYILFRPIERYDFWEAVTGKRIDFSRNFLLNEKATPEEQEHIRTFFARIVKYQKRKRLAIKITGPARMEYLMSIFPDAQFINIQRDPVATIRSWMEIYWNEQITNQLWWQGAYTAAELKKAEELSSDKFLFAAFQYRKLMETTQQEIEKMHPDIYTTSYEDFVKDPKAFVKNLMDFAHLQPSKLVDTFMQKLSIANRNERKAVSENSEITPETKQQIMEIVNA
ncbi:sulfotransferase [Parafilimonas terrae]|uniref:Sulfotransferase family protein n=1 Tax=Parafilimonas terrae TaxID=1465490 RepID=A0A1I5S8W2_9BACT|nr:sulfotransferase [Parafilimonas terrae]SFP67151.1 Sulfotransferase family protein [Parafilimonas terrae]